MLSLGRRRSRALSWPPPFGRWRWQAWLFVATALGVASCAIYDDTWRGECIDCAPMFACGVPGDCLTNETCGDDGFCHSGSCEVWGCVAPYTCEPSDRGPSRCRIEASGSGGSGGQGGSTTQTTSTGSSTTSTGEGGATTTTSTSTGEGGASASFCGNPADCDAGQTCGQDGTCQLGTCSEIACIAGYVCGGDGVCVTQNAAACGRDGDCLAADHLCVSGICTPPTGLCFDRVQCPTGSSCADGKCIPSCASSAPCPDDWLCNDTTLVCSTPEQACATTSDCGGPERVCVGGACVPRSVGATCPVGMAWVQNGCIPEQRPTFSCTQEGEQGECAGGLLCVHGTCFVPCAPPDEDVCQAIPGIEQCKTVDGPTGTFEICGGEGNLGGACDLSLGVACDRGVCVDGSCR